MKENKENLSLTRLPQKNGYKKFFKQKANKRRKLGVSGSKKECGKQKCK